MNKKFITLILAATLLISMAAASGMIFTAKALATPSITITATTSTGISVTSSSTSISLCTNSPVTLTATISGGSSPQTSSITWQSSSTTGTFSTATTTSTTSTVTYKDTNAGSVTLTATYPGDSNNAAAENTISLKIYNIDFNHDGLVNYLDILAFVQEYIAYHSNPANYNSAYDLAGDGAIDFNSLTLFVSLYDSYQGPI